MHFQNVLCWCIEIQLIFGYCHLFNTWNVKFYFSLCSLSLGHLWFDHSPPPDLLKNFWLFFFSLSIRWQQSHPFSLEYIINLFPSTGCSTTVLDPHFSFRGFLTSSNFPSFSCHDIFQITFDHIILYLKSLTTSNYSYNEGKHYVNVLTLLRFSGSNHTLKTTLHPSISSHTCPLSVPGSRSRASSDRPWTDGIIPFAWHAHLATLTLITPYHPSDLREGP